MLRPHALLLTVFGLLLFVSYFPPRTSTSQSAYHSLSLNGTSGYVSVPYSSTIDIGGAITIEAWVKVNAITGNYQDIVCRESWGQAGTGGGYEFSLTSTGKLRLDLYQSHNQYTTAIGSTTVTTGTWHHVAGVFDGNQIRVYLDGVMDGSLSTTNGPASGTSPLNIGKSTYTTYYFGGLIDQVRISAAALYSSNFTPGLGPANNTRAFWKFDGQTANDVSGNGNHGTLEGNAAHSTDVPSANNSAPTVSIAHPQNNTSIASGSTVMIDANATDGDGVVTKVDFYRSTTLLGTDISAPYSFGWNNVPGGVYSITAKATDDNGAVTTSSAITLNVIDSVVPHSLSLNGTSGYVSVPYSSTIDISGAITIEAWIKINAITGNYQDIVCRESWGQAGTGGGYEFSLTSTGKLRLDLYQSHNQYTTAIGSTTVTTGTWHHVAGVFDGNQIRVYLDGVMDGSLSTTNGPASGTSPLNIGKSTYTTYYFGGLIDQVRISAAALYSSNFTPGLGPANNTRAFWKFDGQTANDVSGNGNHGTLEGNATYSANVPPQSVGQRPVAVVAGSPYSGQPGQAVQFSSAGSSDPDGTIVSYHWNFGDSTSANTANPTHTYGAPGLYTATLTVTDNTGLLASVTTPVTISSGSDARLDPLNATGGGGENPLSQNFNWSVPLVSLPGRAGLDLSLTLSYNSLVWTKTGNYISFDSDRGFPGPGFRLGFPVIQPIYYNTEVGKDAFLLIGPDGSRTELRQVGTSSLYEAADSSHLLLDANTMMLRTTDGTQLSYMLMGNEYQCTQIKDRNGNYISITYTPFGRIDEIIDTLERHIKFNYDVAGYVTSIAQVWNEEDTHTWASFEYVDTTIDTKFSSSLTMVGTSNGSKEKMLSKVTLPDESHYDFSYSTWGQVWKISLIADNQVLNYRSYDLPQTKGANAYGDCPRFTERRDWAMYWNGDTNGTPAANEEALTWFSGPVADTWTMPDESSKSGTRAQVTLPDGTVNKAYFVGIAGTPTGWRRGLPLLVDTVSGGDIKRRVVTTWTQDDTAASYPLNPRVTETNIHDDANNRIRTVISYQQFTFANDTSCWLPRDVFEYADANTVLRTTRTNYNTSASYTDRRILGLPSEKLLYEGDVDDGGVLKSKLEFHYDESGAVQGNDEPVQHDHTNYNAAFVTGRANLSSIRRYNVDNLSQFTTTRRKFNTAGAVVSSKDASDHEVKISYVDSFSDNVSRDTFAYPTTITDPDNNIFKSKYNFDFGAVTYKQTPMPNEAPNEPEPEPGPEQTYTFDTIGRLQRITNGVNNAYTRFVYAADQLRVDTYITMEAGLDEAHSFRITDGHGRVIATASDHPGSDAGFSGQKSFYDVLGRVFKTSNPTETSASGTPFQWAAEGDDANWIYTEQTYDWKGRPLRTTHPDTTYREASYAGCGCAGGEVVTLTDEGTIDGGATKRRQQKIYSDVLGRTVKTEVLNWEGGTVYSATVNTYNVRDQITAITQYAGPVGSGSTSQVTTITYDGYGRLSSRHLPEQNTGTATVWTYNADDTINTITDARGAVTTFGYAGTNRHLVKSMTHTMAGSPTISFTYAHDTVGNVTSMNDGLGAVTYTYNDLSQLTSETRTFTGLNSFTINYDYNLAGQLKSVTDAFGAQVGYTHDRVGRVTAITGSNFASVSSYASNMEYRAWGGLKSLTYGNSKTLALTYDLNLNVSTYEVAGIMKKSYQYYNDGRLKFTQDQLVTNSKFDRLYRYDHTGRNTRALSGLEAREEGTTNDRPYNETMTYDPFGHLTSREVLHWDRYDMSGPDTYVNNRRTLWEYDADGRLLQGDSTYTYDASGAIASFGDANPYVTEQQFDGLGRRAKSVLKHCDINSNQWTTEKVTYYVSSTVLGSVISEVSSTGAKERTFVFAGKNVMAIQNAGSSPPVTWEHYDPSRASYRATDAQGIGARFGEMDPLGADAGIFKPITWSPPTSAGRIERYYDIPLLNNTTQGCVLDRVPISCEVLERLMEAGGVEQEYLMPMEQKSTLPWIHALTVVREPITSRGVGLFSVGVPRWGFDQNEDGIPDMEPSTFAFAPIDWAVLRSSLKTCINKLWEMFEMTGFKPTAPAGEGGKADDDRHNGVITIHDAQLGQTINVTNDPTPPPAVKADLIANDARGSTDLRNPFWNYAYPKASPKLRAGEKRYPELFGQSSMDYVRVQIHELAVSLSAIRDIYHPAPRLPLKNELDPDHLDDGPPLEDCVGREYYRQMGLTPVLQK